ncbi:MAG: hypothetical protein LYZ66_02205 [Nitrososphaerales archaeon]|nr:hypothetical protein [Nitrososphaerales archaeon]
MMKTTRFGPSLKVFFAVALSLITVSLAFHLPSPTTSNNGLTQGAVLPTQLLGTRVNSTEAQQQAAFHFRAPQYLPTNTTLFAVYLSDDRRTVRLFYNNSGLSDATEGSLAFPAQIAITAEASETNPLNQIRDQMRGFLPPIIVQVQNPKGGTNAVQTIPQQIVGNMVTVCGVSGFGRDPLGNQSGALLWWSNGVTYIIKAGLPLSILELIADSMC